MTDDRAWVYTIPYQGQYIVYQPLKHLAFVANAALVNFIVKQQQEPSHSKAEISEFLDSIGFWEKDPPAPPSSTIRSSFKPTIATLFLTTACNLHCIYCYASAGDSKIKNLPIAVGRKAIDIVCQNAIETKEEQFTLGFHGGGEPTLAKNNFKELVTYARQKTLPCRINVTSNGLWSKNLRDWILNHIDEVSLSFDGMAAIQDNQRPLASGRGSFKGVFETIGVLDKREVPYGIRLTVTDASIAKLIENITFLCKETACQSFQVEPAFDYGRAHTDALALSQLEDFAVAFMEAFEIAEAYGRNLYYSGARPWTITNMFCQAPERALVVEPGGAITACYEVFSETHQLANSFVYGNVSASGAEVDFIRRNRLLTQIQERRDLCENCFCYWHCAGDCPAKTFTPEGDGHLLFGARCDLNRMITRELLAHTIAASGGVWRG
jgi:uncharacterized protein